MNLLEEKEKELQQLRNEMKKTQRSGDIEAEKAIIYKILEIETSTKRERKLLDRLLELEPNNINVLTRRAEIAKQFGELELEKTLIEKILELEPDNTNAIFEVMRLEKRQKGRDAELKFIGKLLESKLDDKEIIYQLIMIVRRRNMIGAEIKLLDRIIELDPEDVKAISSRIRMAYYQKDDKTVKKMLYKLLILEPDNLKTIRAMLQFAKKEKNTELINKLLRLREAVKADLDYESLLEIINSQEAKQEEQTEKEDLTSRIELAKQTRKLIYEENDIMQCAEQIKEMLEGQDELYKELVLSELFLNSGLHSRAQKSLKAYKKRLEENPEKQRELRIVKKALELTRNAKTRKSEWDEFWKNLIIGQKESIKKELDER